MKYLVQNKDALIRAIVGVIVAAIQLLKVFGLDIGVTEDAILSIVTVIVGFICFFYNNPTSKENCEATGEMRMKKAAKKALKKGIEIVGEEFTNDGEEVDE